MTAYSSDYRPNSSALSYHVDLFHTSGFR